MCVIIASCALLLFLSGFFPRKNGFKVWSSKEWGDLKKKHIVLWFLTAEAVIFFVTTFLYLVPVCENGAMSNGIHDACDYTAFSFPCLAGIFVGGGFIYKKKDREIFSDINFSFYFSSVVLLAVAYVAYLTANFRPLVVVPVAGMVAIFSLICLLITSLRRLNSSAGISTQTESLCGLSSVDEELCEMCRPAYRQSDGGVIGSVDGLGTPIIFGLTVFITILLLVNALVHWDTLFGNSPCG